MLFFWKEGKKKVSDNGTFHKAELTIGEEMDGVRLDLAVSASL